VHSLQVLVCSLPFLCLKNCKTYRESVLNINMFNFSPKLLFRTFFALMYLGVYTSANHTGLLVGVYCEDLKELECTTMD
jgi:hypothetical protein